MCTAECHYYNLLHRASSCGSLSLGERALCVFSFTGEGAPEACTYRPDSASLGVESNCVDFRHHYGTHKQHGPLMMVYSLVLKLMHEQLWCGSSTLQEAEKGSIKKGMQAITTEKKTCQASTKKVAAKCIRTGRTRDDVFHSGRTL